MTVEQSIIERKDFYINYIKKLVKNIKRVEICKEDANDILLDIFLIIKDNNIKVTDPMIYLLATIRFQLLYKNSNITRTYFNPLFSYNELEENIEDINENNDDIPCLNDIKKDIDKIFNKIKDIYWFDKEIFLYYYSNNISLRRLEQKTHIPYITLYKSIEKTKKELNLTKYDEKCLKFNKKYMKLILL